MTKQRRKPGGALSRLRSSYGRCLTIPVDNIVVECQDTSKQKQAEYLLDSYSQMAEKNARDLQREKDRAERLLLNIMPKSVLRRDARLRHGHAAAVR